MRKLNSFSSSQAKPGENENFVGECQKKSIGMAIVKIRALAK